MSLFDFILSLLLALNPGISEADFSNVYSLLDDASIHSVVVEDSAFDRLSQLGDSGVMPLDLNSQQNGWLGDIRNALYGSSGTAYPIYSLVSSIAGHLYGGLGGTSTRYSAAEWLAQINLNTVNLQNLFSTGTFQGRESIYGLLSRLLSYLQPNPMTGVPSKMLDFLASIDSKLSTSSASGGWRDKELMSLFNPYLWSYEAANVSPFDLLSLFREGLFVSLWAQKGWGTIYGNLDHPVSFSELFINTSWAFRGLLTAGPGWSIVDWNGDLLELTEDMSLAGLFSRAMLGQRNYLVGVDRKTAFSFLSEDITQEPTIVEVDNMLDALGHIGTELQNPLQRLAFVFANPLDLEIKENVTENTESANDSFLKPGSPGSVKPSDITDAAGIAGGAGDFISAGGSPGDAFVQLGQGSDNWSFFSQQAMEDMLGNPPPMTVSEDGIPSNYELGDDGLYHILPAHLFEVDSKLGKGG